MNTFHKIKYNKHFQACAFHLFLACLHSKYFILFLPAFRPYWKIKFNMIHESIIVFGKILFVYFESNYRSFSRLSLSVIWSKFFDFTNFYCLFIFWIINSGSNIHSGAEIEINQWLIVGISLNNNIFNIRNKNKIEKMLNFNDPHGTYE